MIPELQKPFGLFFKLEPNKPSPEKQVISYLLDKPSSIVIVVGDFVSKTLLQEKFLPDLIIIDNFTQRTVETEIILPKSHFLKEIENPPGEISKNAWNLVKNEFKNLKEKALNKEFNPLSVIVIKGEEDLLALPAILEAPLGSFVLYGQPPMINDGSTGIVLIEVTEEKKSYIDNLLNKFDHI